MKRQAAAILSILLSVIVISTAASGTYVLYDRFGVGTWKSYFTIFDSSDAESRSGGVGDSYTIGISTGDAPPLRLVGTPDEPAVLALFGTSMTRQGLFPALADDLRSRFGVEVYNLGWPSSRIDRMVDTIRTAHAVRPINIAVVEFGPVFSSDHMLLYYPSNFVNAASRYQPPVFDDAIVRARAIVGTQNSFVSSREDGEQFLEHMRRRWDASAEEPDRGSNPQEDASYRRFSKMWSNRYGTEDVTTEPTAWLESSRVAGVALERLAAYCRSEGIALIVYVPPRSPDWRLDPDGVCPLLVSSAAGAKQTLEFEASVHGFKVLDFDAWTDDTSLFVDELHLNAGGARLFSPRFFAAVGEFIESGAADASYERFAAE